MKRNATLCVLTVHLCTLGCQGLEGICPASASRYVKSRLLSLVPHVHLGALSHELGDQLSHLICRHVAFPPDDQVKRRGARGWDGARCIGSLSQECTKHRRAARLRCQKHAGPVVSPEFHIHISTIVNQLFSHLGQTIVVDGGAFSSSRVRVRSSLRFCSPLCPSCHHGVQRRFPLRIFPVHVSTRIKKEGLHIPMPAFSNKVERCLTPICLSSRVGVCLSF
mmetsp:Transcript_43842/g.80313  ORF Transcript_43842/g.80313 Transcript_43842/m.80313 type:complete len:222 (-) Transcript_43842:44-709(-)